MVKEQVIWHDNIDTDNFKLFFNSDPDTEPDSIYLTRVEQEAPYKSYWEVEIASRSTIGQDILNATLPLINDITNLQTDIQNIKVDITDIQSDIVTMNVTITDHEDRISTLETQVSILQTDIQTINQTLTNFIEVDSIADNSYSILNNDITGSPTPQFSFELRKTHGYVKLSTYIDTSSLNIKFNDSIIAYISIGLSPYYNTVSSTVVVAANGVMRQERSTVILPFNNTNDCHLTCHCTLLVDGAFLSTNVPITFLVNNSEIVYIGG